MIVATDIYCLNELGKRANNEDSVSPKNGTATLSDKLFVVCDGVGGENKGEVASEIVCTSIQEQLRKQTVANGNAQDILQKAIQAANTKLTAYASTDASAKRMSTTLALVFLTDEMVLAAWCGDTRIHHIRNGKILWKSRDHSLVSELISQGELTEDEARRHPRRNVITRSLNALNYNNTVDFHEIREVEAGDYFLLCTDGFLENITERLIDEILTNDGEEDKAKSFLQYCDGNTRDNFSMYLVRVGRSEKRVVQKKGVSVLLLLSLLLLLLCLTILLLA